MMQDHRCHFHLGYPRAKLSCKRGSSGLLACGHQYGVLYCQLFGFLASQESTLPERMRWVGVVSTCFINASSQTSPISSVYEK